MKKALRYGQAIVYAFILLLVFVGTEAEAYEVGSQTLTIDGKTRTIKYVSYHPSEHLALKVAFANDKVGTVQPLHDMANDHEAVAAINGTFFNAYDAADLQPMGAIMVQRDLKHLRGSAVGIGMTTSGHLIFGSANMITINGTMNDSSLRPNTWHAGFFNHLPSKDNEVVVFTSAFRTEQLDIPDYVFVIVEDGGASSGLYADGQYITRPGRALSTSLVLVKQPPTPAIHINDREIFFKDADPFNENGTIMVPVRGVFEQLGARLEWNGKLQQVTATRFDTTVTLTVNSDIAYVNGEAEELKVAPRNIEGRVYIPLRFVSQALGAEVNWVGKQNLVTIYSDIMSAQEHFDLAMSMERHHANFDSVQEHIVLQLELATRIQPDFNDAWFMLGKEYDRVRDYDKAIQAYAQISDERAWLAIGWAAYYDGQYELAKAYFKKAAKIPSMEESAQSGLRGVAKILSE